MVDALPLPPPQVPLFMSDGKPTQQGFEFLDRLQSLVKQINASLGSLNYAPTAAQYVTMAADATLTVERILAVSAALSLTDGGANNPVTIGRAALAGDVTAAANSNSVRVDQASEAFSFTGVITPPQLTADQNNYNPTGLGTASVLRLTSDATVRHITGIAAQPGGRIIQLFNCNALGGTSIIIDGLSGSSSPANQFAGGTTIFAASWRPAWYDATSSRWRLLI